MLNPDYVAPPNVSTGYYEGIALYMKMVLFACSRKLDVRKNLALLWSWENGRFFRSVILIWNVAGRNSF
jgi:uncharacterized protein